MLSRTLSLALMHRFRLFALGLPEAGPPPEGQRVSKLMTERGLASRREADDLIEQGRVTVTVGDHPALAGAFQPYLAAGIAHHDLRQVRERLPGQCHHA